MQAATPVSASRSEISWELYDAFTAEGRQLSLHDGGPRRHSGRRRSRHSGQAAQPVPSNSQVTADMDRDRCSGCFIPHDNASRKAATPSIKPSLNYDHARTCECRTVHAAEVLLAAEEELQNSAARAGAPVDAESTNAPTHSAGSPGDGAATAAAAAAANGALASLSFENGSSPPAAALRTGPAAGSTNPAGASAGPATTESDTAANKDLGATRASPLHAAATKRLRTAVQAAGDLTHKVQLAHGRWAVDPFQGGLFGTSVLCCKVLQWSSD